MFQPARILRLLATLALCSALFPAVGRAGTWVAFGPKTYTRGNGAPVTVKDTFTLRNPATRYTLKVFNGGLEHKQAGLVSDCVVRLNGVQIAGPNNCNRKTSELDVPIMPLKSNTLSVKLQGRASAALVVAIIGVDNDLPTITGAVSPPPDASGWNSSGVTVSFTCSDKTSGVAFCSSPVTLNKEGPGQVVIGRAKDAAGNAATVRVEVNISFDFFKVQSWQGGNDNSTSQQGKCLDYETSPSGNGASVFLNDCAIAHPVRVEELPDRKGSGGITLSHEVMLFAGKLVIGIHRPPENTLGDAPSESTAPSESLLELQIPWNAPSEFIRSNPANQIFRLDGDSIILEGAHSDPMTHTVIPGPCINTDISTGPATSVCPRPPPQLVIQVQNARGTNRSPLVAGVRNLADNEFWNFIAVDGSGRYPTHGFFPVASPDALWNKICDNPTADMVTSGDITAIVPPSSPCMIPDGFTAGWGTVILVSSPADCVVSGPVPGQPMDIGGCLDFSAYPPIVLPPGVTLRGNRRGINFGPQLYASYSVERGLCGLCMIEVSGDYVRVTGLRMRGQSRSTDPVDSRTQGIQVDYLGRGNPVEFGQIPVFGLGTVTEFIATIDHNDMSDWGDAAVAGSSPFHNSSTTDDNCTYDGYSPAEGTIWYLCDQSDQRVPFPRSTVPEDSNVPIVQDPFPFNPSVSGTTPTPGTLENMRVARNFLHDNRRNNGGYGVGATRALIDANTFLMNRHDISAAGEAHSQYRASHNLVLAGKSSYPFVGTLQDFDMHGTATVTYCLLFDIHCWNGLYFGGAGGYYVEIDGNTFLGGRHDYLLRGCPVHHTQYHGNVSLHNQGDAVKIFTAGIGCPESDFPIDVANDNQFADSSPPYTNPTARLAVGDFDGDGKMDLFMTTGAAWYYSPGANAEWRFLSAKPDKLDSLLLGDFDGDGRTDVVGMNPSGMFDASWGGVSDFEVINENPCANGPNPCPTSIHDMVVGDFDGDGIPDIFYADGEHWYISFGGTAPFALVNDSSFRVKDLRFGHFSICGNNKETDVFGIVGEPVGKWMVTCGARGDWVPLPVSLTDRLNGAVIDGGVVIRDLVVADFDGDGNADIAGFTDPIVIGATTGLDLLRWSWTFSPDGAGDWNSHWHNITPSGQPPEPCGFSFSTDQLPTMLNPVPAGQKTTAAYGALLAAIGPFSGQSSSDILLWGDTRGNNLCIAQGGTGDAQRQSRQDMR